MPINILHISTFDIQGGAARATYRLHQGLRQIGQNSRMIVRHKSSTDEYVLPVSPALSIPNTFSVEAAIQEYYIDAHRTSLSDTIFSFPYHGYDLSSLSIVQEAEIINLHWVARFQSPVTLQNLFKLSKPVIWTFHDQWAFTGGCHYSAGCNNYRNDCASCPQLMDDNFNLPKAILNDKIALFRNANLTIVTPSHWLASCVKRSKLFKDVRVEVIPYSLDIQTYFPSSKSEAKRTLGLGPETKTILFAAEDTKEKRKGFPVILEAIQNCLSNDNFRNLIVTEGFRLLTFGHPGDDLFSNDLPILSLGHLDSEEQISLVYSAADLFILPSTEDNLPLTMLEAMSCGTPVIGSNVGGMPDMVIEGLTGKLFSPKNAGQLSEVIMSLIFDPNRMKILSQNCRRFIEKDYALHTQADRYLDLYSDTLTGLPRSPVLKIKLNQTNQSKPDPPGDLSISIEATLGPHFQQIYSSVLNKALQEFALAIEQKWQTSEADRSSRFNQIVELTHLLKESEEDRTARLEQVNQLTHLLKESEDDRTARLEQINQLTHLLKKSEDDRTARLEQINQLTHLLKKSEEDRAARLEQINQLTHLLKESEEDRAARLELINQLTHLLKKSEEDRTGRISQVEKLSQMVAVQKDLLESTQAQLEKLMGLPEIRLRKKLSGLLKKN